jgi:predicted  nucleic acid-binding Zn-ribbon protein
MVIFLKFSAEKRFLKQSNSCTAAKRTECDDLAQKARDLQHALDAVEGQLDDNNTSTGGEEAMEEQAALHGDERHTSPALSSAHDSDFEDHASKCGTTTASPRKRSKVTVD